MIAKKEFGFYAKDQEVFQQMLYADALRGWDATGIFGVDRLGNVDIKKAAVAAGPFLTTKPYEDFKKNILSKYRFIVGHNRKATVGEKRHKDAHPFWNKEEKICLVHNGMVSNHKEFCKEATVDSASMVTALSNTDDMRSVIAKVEGAFAFIWYNTEEKTLHFIRNNMRPLFIVETDDNILLVSEQSMGFWICHRNNIKVTSMTECLEMVPYSIDLTDRKVKQGEKIEKEKKFIPATTGGNRNTVVTTVAGTETVLDTKTYDTYYLSNDDFKTPEDVLNKLKIKDRINIQISSYDGPTGGYNNHCLVGNMINVDRTWMEVRVNLSKMAFDALDISGVLSVIVSTIVSRNNQVVIYAHSPEEQIFKECLNETIVTDPMWFDDRFPVECDVCNGQIKYKHLEDCNIWIEDRDVINVICPTCSGVTHAH